MTKAEYELPDGISEDDAMLLHNILTAMRAGSVCLSYRVDVIPTGFLIRGALQSDNFEIESDDIFLIGGVSPLRIERIAVARAGGLNELVVKVLDAKQKVTIIGSATFTVSKRRKLMATDGGSAL